ncbi:MAG TPA: 5-oxoprolinase subunit PxpB [Opitutaceae bacterium]|nr:5-oxoprolinase subunit PxpB [Opitutaceae bacterium]
MQVTPLGDSTLVLTLGDSIDEDTLTRVQSACAALEAAALPAVTELVPAYTTVTLFYDPAAAAAAGAPARDIAGWLGVRVLQAAERAVSRPPALPGRVIEIPICYEREYAPDLAEVAERTGLAAAEIVRLHLAAEYLVYLVGFAPGFPYMGGLPAQLAIPRRPVPRKRVPPGSVGIIGAQCGIYPIETPAGWNLIGRTPRPLFRPAHEPPVLLQAGDRVRFRRISAAEFEEWEETA